jgi:hypothetical protein
LGVVSSIFTLHSTWQQHKRCVDAKTATKGIHLARMVWMGGFRGVLQLFDQMHGPLRETYAHIVADANLIKQPAAMQLLCHAKELVLSTAESLSCMLQQASKLTHMLAAYQRADCCSPAFVWLGFLVVH